MTHNTLQLILRRLGVLVVVAVAAARALPAGAVTDREMEQARVIAVQTYLRYANDGSGYLDDLHPTTMAQLEKSLKPIERENIKAAKSVAVPSGYADWDKARLVEYWGTTFFNSPALSNKGKIGKSRARTRLQKLTVAAPAPKEAPKPEAPKAETPAQAAPDGTARADQAAAERPAAAPAEQTAPAQPQQGVSDKTPAPANDNIAEDAISAEAEVSTVDEPVRKRNDSTWIYVVILCVLVAVVVALVIFASSTMRNRGEDDETPEERSRSLRRMEEAHRADMEARNADLEEQKRLAGNMETELGRLAEENDRLRRELEAERAATARLRAEHERAVADLQGRLASANAAASAAAEAARAARVTAQAATVSQASAPAPAVPASPRTSPRTAASARTAPQAPVAERKIYLGRVNVKGLFVRADRTLNPEGSVYVMETDDGYSGSFRVVRNREVWNRLLEDPAHWLGNGCAISQTEDGEPMAIVTERAGTTVFEDGCWRVIRKAKVRLD